MEDSDARHPARRLRRLLTEPVPAPDPSRAPGRAAPAPEEMRGDAGPATPRDGEGWPAGTGSVGLLVEGAAGSRVQPRRGLARRGFARRRPRTVLVAAAIVALVGAAIHEMITGGPPPPRSPAPPPPSAAPAPALAAGSAPSARLDAALAYDPSSRRVILYGGLVFRGNPQESALSDTWSWDGRRWTERRPRVSPPPLSGALLGYDPRSGTLVLAGGETSDARGLVPNSTTWTWNGSTWSLDAAAALPSGEWPSALGTDPASGQLILLTTGPGCLGVETWVWSASGDGSRGGGRWAALHPAASPPPAVAYGFAYDPVTAGLDLFRGSGYCAGSTNSAAAAVWSWQGGAWSSDAAAVGSQLAGPWEMTTWSAGELLVTTHSTFTWTGGARGSWRSVGSSPGEVGDAALAYDASTRQVVLFGGTCAACAGEPMAQTWIMTGGGWVAESA